MLEFSILVAIIVVGLGLYMYNTNRRQRELEESRKALETPSVPEAEPARCGCGRSPTGLCVGLHKLTVEEWSVHADNPNRVVAAAPEVKVEEKPAKKPAAKKPKVNKPAAKKAPAKKSRATK